MPTDVLYIVVFLALFLIPKLLQRYRLPSAVTSLLLGIGVSLTGVFQGDATLPLLSTLGIVALFLSAGLEIDFAEIRRGSKILSIHLLIQAVILCGMTWLLSLVFGLEIRAGALVALALLTPSAGFILDSLDHFGLSGEARFWTKAKVISAELLALTTLFVVMQSSSLWRLLLATVAMVALITVIPYLFRFFAARIAPYAPRSEFAFLLLVALICAYATRKLGVYYLVGAFLVGVAAQRFRLRLPAISSEKMLTAVEAFTSVFAPFYFFVAGVRFDLRTLDLAGILAGLILILICLPLRMGLVFLLRKRLFKEERLETRLRISASLLPTLVFTLVLAQILREQFQAPAYLFGGLMLYAVASTLIPSIFLHSPPPEYESPHICEEAAPATSDLTAPPGKVDGN